MLSYFRKTVQNSFRIYAIALSFNNFKKIQTISMIIMIVMNVHTIKDFESVGLASCARFHMNFKCCILC